MISILILRQETITKRFQTTGRLRETYGALQVLRELPVLRVQPVRKSSQAMVHQHRHLATVTTFTLTILLAGTTRKFPARGSSEEACKDHRVQPAHKAPEVSTEPMELKARPVQQVPKELLAHKALEVSMEQTVHQAHKGFQVHKFTPARAPRLHHLATTGTFTSILLQRITTRRFLALGYSKEI